MHVEVSGVKCKDATATVLFVTVAATALAICLITTLVLWLLDTVSELVDLCCEDLDFVLQL